MTSSIGQGAYGNPMRMPIANSLLSGSTSGIGGQSTETVTKYDSSYTLGFKYVPGSKRFHKIGGYRYDGPKGNWGNRVLSKVNLRKQVQGSSGYLSSNPLARTKHTKFISMNYGRVAVNPFLPRGGSIPRVVDTSNVEDPRSFYSDYNWTNKQQYHENAGDYYTIPKNDPKEKGPPVDPDTQPPSSVSNPMSGPGGIGGGPDPQELKNRILALQQSQKEYKKSREGSSREEPDLFDPSSLLSTFGLDENPSGVRAGNFGLSRRRASVLTQIYDNPVAAIADSRKQVSTSSFSYDTNDIIDTYMETNVAKGAGLLSGITTNINPEQQPQPMEIFTEKIKKIRAARKLKDIKMKDAK